MVSLGAVSAGLAIALVAIGLVGVALVTLFLDVARGDVGGHHTMSRARRLLVIATDDETGARADSWIDEQHAERPELQCFLLVQPDSQDLFQSIEDVIERDHPDAIVWVRHEGEGHSESGTFGRVKEQYTLPIDTVHVPAGSAA